MTVPGTSRFESVVRPLLFVPQAKRSSVNVSPHCNTGARCAGPGSPQVWRIFNWPQVREFGRPPRGCVNASVASMPRR